MKTKFSECTEETLEEKLDRLNYALKYTIKDADSSYHYKRNISQISNLNSFTTSFCNFDSLEQEFLIGNKEFSCAEENIESVFISLDRAQMQIEDFWAEQVRNEENIKSKNQFDELKINKLNKKNVVAIKIEEVEKMIKSLKNEKFKVRNFEQTLKNREKELALKQNEFEINKNRHEKIVAGKSMGYYDGRSLNLLRLKDFNTDENFIGDEIENNPLLVQLKQELERYEMKLKMNRDQEKRKKLIYTIYQITNKIATIRGERVIMDCSKTVKLKKPN